jgi:hypothetical protein
MSSASGTLLGVLLGVLLVLGGPVLLDVLALRFGYDSRDSTGPVRPLSHRPR